MNIALLMFIGFIVYSISFYILDNTVGRLIGKKFPNSYIGKFFIKKLKL